MSQVRGTDPQQVVEVRMAMDRWLESVEIAKRVKRNSDRTERETASAASWLVTSKRDLLLAVDALEASIFEEEKPA